MKICAVISEYNPFHNGHLYQLDKIKRQTGCDALVVIMSGNFSQRGEPTVLDKYTRASHAIKGGADIVFELPSVFCTAPAELFALGAVKLLSSLKGEKTLCFGCESGDKQSFISTAKTLLQETEEFKTALKKRLAEGESLARARINALKDINAQNVDLQLLSSPNNILGIEYSKAIISLQSDMDILPLPRVGAGYSDDVLYEDLSSATAIRKAIADGDKSSVIKNLPDYVYKDLPSKLPNADDVIIYSAVKSSHQELKKTTDCTEGLENRIKALCKDCYSLDELIPKLTTKRYTEPRLRRILTRNALGITHKFTERCLKSTLPLKVLAIEANKTDLLSTLKGYRTYPFITRKSDVKALKGVALECFEQDVRSNDVYNLLNKKHTNEYEMKIVKR